MRRNTVLLAAAVFLLPLVTACEGPQGVVGPTGTTGVAGPQGPTGPVGPAGQDTNENCTQCHADNVTLFAKQVQYEQSTHRLGGNFERATTSCAVCHTHQGFLERLVTGATSTAEDVLDPAPINCRTCHQIHTTYTAADYALTASGPNDMIFNASQGPIDFGTIGNLCTQCHQARTLSPYPEIGGDSVTLTSTRYGWHHGPQGQILGGVGAFDVDDDDIPGGPSAHGLLTANPNTCGTCHMGKAYGEQAGGHTWKMSYDYHGSDVNNIAGCVLCHTTLTDFDYIGLQTMVEGLLDDLAVELRRVGVMQASPSHYAEKGTFPADVVAAFANWQMIEEDRSKGVHNPPYVEAILSGTIAKMKTY